jgi:hypothetical protein
LIKSLYIFFIISIVLIGCDKKQTPENGTVLAIVGGEILYLEYAILNIPPAILANDSTAAVHRYRDNWVFDKILYQEALRLGLDNSKQIIERISKAKRDILIEALREQIVSNNPGILDISNDEIRNFYESNRDQFVLQERHISLRLLSNSSMQEVQRAREELFRGVEWDDVVEAYAINKEQARTLEKQLLPVASILNDLPSLKAFVGVIGLNEISPIRRDGEYYHFIQIVEDRPVGDHPDLDWVFSQIKEWLIVEKTRRAINIYEQNLFLQAEANNEIQIFN